MLADLVTNLSATLLLVPLLVPLGGTAILAALIGLNVGSGLTWTGSLANLLWRRGLDRLELPPSSARVPPGLAGRSRPFALSSRGSARSRSSAEARIRICGERVTKLRGCGTVAP